MNYTWKGCHIKETILEWTKKCIYCSNITLNTGLNANNLTSCLTIRFFICILSVIDMTMGYKELVEPNDAFHLVFVKRSYT